MARRTPPFCRARSAGGSISGPEGSPPRWRSGCRALRRRDQEHLFYVIHRDRMRGMCITPYRAYLKKDESIGSNFHEFNRRSSWGRKNLTVQDAAILGKLDFFSDGGFQPSYDWPDGKELTGLVREIVETGRARAGEIRGMALSWSPPRRLDLAWEVGPAGEQSIVARDGAGSTMTLLPFPSPFFLDPATGETGVAETSLSPRMASWFASAPPVPHESVGAVTAKLSRVGQHAPVPRLQRVEDRTDVRPEPVLTLYGCEQNVTLYAPGEYRRAPGKDVSAVFPCARLEIAYEGAGRRLRPGGIGGLQADGDCRPAVIRRDPVREAGFREALVQEAKRHGGKDPSALRHEIRLLPGVLDADFVFPPLRDGDEGEAAAAGIGFVSRTVPALRAKGWRVEIDKTWPFRIYEGPVAFSTALESSDSDWFSLALSLEANGQTFDIAPIVLQIVDALPVNEWGQLEDGFDVDRHLAGRVIHARFEDGTYLAIDGARFARFAEAFLEAPMVRCHASHTIVLLQGLHSRCVPGPRHHGQRRRFTGAFEGSSVCHVRGASYPSRPRLLPVCRHDFDPNQLCQERRLPIDQTSRFGQSCSQKPSFPLVQLELQGTIATKRGRRVRCPIDEKA